MSVRADGRVLCHRPCTREIPKDAVAGYTCPDCGHYHLFLPLWPCCGKSLSSDAKVGDKCPWCKTFLQRLRESVASIRIS